jgi:septal ring factor EnvC (AmiA/AmiB activator)
LAAAFIAALSASAEDKKDLQQIEQDLNHAKATAKSLEERGRELQSELDILRERLVAAASDAQNAEQELSSESQILAGLEEEEQIKTADLARQRNETALTLAALQRLALRPPVALIAAPGTPLETVRGALLLKSAVPALTQRTQALRVELESLARVRQEIIDTHRALDRAATQRSTAAQEIASLIDAKAALLAQTLEASRQANERAAALAAQAKDLRDLLDRLAAAEKQAGVAEKAESPAATDQGLLTVPGNLGPPAQAPAAVATIGPQAIPLVERPTLIRPFPHSPGSLFMPARGKVARLFDPSLESGPLSKGVVIQTLPEAQVVAPFDGHVVFQGPFRGYGSILIIEHADGYHTLLSGLGRIDAAVGQWLLAGEPVGVMGSDGTPELYVELRRASQPIDPLPWLKISGDKVKG